MELKRLQEENAELYRTLTPNNAKSNTSSSVATNSNSNGFGMSSHSSNNKKLQTLEKEVDSLRWQLETVGKIKFIIYHFYPLIVRMQ